MRLMSCRQVLCWSCWPGSGCFCAHFSSTFGGGLLSLVVPPLALVFALRHAQKAIAPLVFFVLGGMIAAAPVAYSLVGPVDLRLREQVHQEPKFVSVAKTALQSDAAHEWMENRAFYMQSGGVAAAVLAWIWLLIRAFRQDRRWGLSSLIIPPVGAGLRWPTSSEEEASRLVLFSLCLLVAAIPALYTLYVPLDLSAREKVVNGEKHLTLTGSDPKDAPDLKLKQDVTVLQMAKPDVTDESLESLRDMKVLQRARP